MHYFRRNSTAAPIDLICGQLAAESTVFNISSEQLELLWGHFGIQLPKAPASTTDSQGLCELHAKTLKKAKGSPLHLTLDIK